MAHLPHSKSDFMLDVDAQPDLLCVIRAMLDAWCLRAGIERSRADRICLAVDEAVANILRHAYNHGPGRIRMRCRRCHDGGQERLCIELEDDGRQVPLDTIRPRELDDVRPGGLGVHLIQEVMDEVHWSHRPEGGTTLTMYLSVQDLAVTSSPKEGPNV